MTGALDSRLRATAKRLIDNYGKPVVFEYETSESYDPNTGKTTTGTDTVTVNSTPPKQYMLAAIKDTLIEAGDKVIAIPAKDLTIGSDSEPDPSMTVKFDGERRHIVQVGKIYSGEQVALFVLHLRR